MFSWIFGNTRVTDMTQVIYGTCSYAHHLNELTGAPLHKCFLGHAMLRESQAPRRWRA